MPTNVHSASSIGGHAQRAIDAEVAALREEGVQVEVRAPSAQDAERWGPNLMDPTNAPIANEIGVATGRTWADTLR